VDREYLEDYEAREIAEYKILERKISHGTFNFGTDIYPSADRFVNVRHPIAIAGHLSGKIANLWGQVPFCGSLVLTLPSFPAYMFEKTFFKISEIPKVIDFIKSTGQLQVALEEKPSYYEGLDYLDQIFKELDPPYLLGTPMTMEANLCDLKKARVAYHALGALSFLSS
jgi:hypothetical protein